MRLKFERRYEEGYDLPDPLYQKWLKITHPESVDNGTLADVFSDIPPLSPVQITDDSHSTLLNPSEVETIVQSTISSSATLLPGSSTQSSSKQQPVKETHDTSNQHTTLLDKILVPPKSKPIASTCAIIK